MDDLTMLEMDMMEEYIRCSDTLLYNQKTLDELKSQPAPSEGLINALKESIKDCMVTISNIESIMGKSRILSHRWLFEPTEK